MNKSKRRRYVCQVDLEGQMMARRQLLETIAQDAAAVAQHTHKRAIIEGLSSGERRTVHYYAGQEGDVETMSEGRDDLRYLMVALKT
jgi:predicted RNA-binding protein Jag